MTKVCTKCGAENKDYNGAVYAACPSCGVIYAKAESPRAKPPKVSEQQPYKSLKIDDASPIISKIFYVLAVLCAIGGIALFFEMRPRPGEIDAGLSALMADVYLWAGLFQGLLLWSIGLVLKYLRGIYLKAISPR